MFNQPIKHVRIQDMAELKKFSFFKDNCHRNQMVACQNNGQIAYVDEHGDLFITPYRTEIWEVLTQAGYKKEDFSVTLSDRDKGTAAYKWLCQIAEEEGWAETHEKALEVARMKGIQPVEVDAKNYRIKEIHFLYVDEECDLVYHPFVEKFLLNSEENVGTYVYVDERTLIICDEYGRTFLVKAKMLVNELVNALIDAGYKRMPHPEGYVRRRKTRNKAEKTEK